MHTIVILINVIVALSCLGLARQCWRLRRRFKKLTSTLVMAEMQAHALLSQAPVSLLSQQLTVVQLNAQLSTLERQVGQAQKLLVLMTQIRRLWTRFQ